MDFYAPHVLKNELVVNEYFSAGKTAMDQNCKFRGEVHDFWEIVYVTSGHLDITSGEVFHSLCPGEIAFHAPGTFHKLISLPKESTEIYCIGFSTNYPLEQYVLGKVFCATEEIKTLYTLLFSIVAHFQKKSIFEGKIHHRIENEDVLYGSEQLMKNYIECILISCLQLLKNQRQVFDHNRIMSSAAELFKMATTYIAEVIMSSEQSREFCISTLCIVLGASRSSLNKAFKKYTDNGIMEYFNARRIDKAIVLIKKGMNIRVVSEMMGFSSQQYFTTVFKRKTGITPSKFKKNFILSK